MVDLVFEKSPILLTMFVTPSQRNTPHHYLPGIDNLRRSLPSWSSDWTYVSVAWIDNNTQKVLTRNTPHRAGVAQIVHPTFGKSGTRLVSMGNDKQVLIRDII